MHLLACSIELYIKNMYINADHFVRFDESLLTQVSQNLENEGVALFATIRVDHISRFLHFIELEQ